MQNHFELPKRWIYLVLNHAQYEKQIKENFVRVIEGFGTYA